MDAEPHKRQQDALDSVICLLVATRWRFERATCLMMGDLRDGYIVAPASSPLRVRLARSPLAAQVPMR